MKDEWQSLPFLSSEEASRRLSIEGYNELPGSKRSGVLGLAKKVVMEPMFLLLISAGVIYLFLGDKREALLLIGSIGVIMAIEFVQERKTERALDALRELSSPRASVIRDGEKNKIPSREVVRGDLIELSEGDRVPADGAVLFSTNLAANESLLTGESVLVGKNVWDHKQLPSRPGGDNLPFVFSGTLITRGRGYALTQAVGLQTEMGKIGKSLQSLEPEQTLLKKEISSFVKKFAVYGFFLCFLVFLAYGLINRDWLQGMLSGLSLAMSLLPEEFPVILTVFLALGAWRLSHKHVLIRKMPALETLGAITVLCVDKTGTLTLNQMTVGAVSVGKKLFEGGTGLLSEDFHETVEFALLASHKDPFDPMEQAIVEFGSGALKETEHLHDNWRLVHQYPLSGKLLAMSQVWSSPEGKDFVVAAKGAPEAVLDICHVSKQKQREIMMEVERMAEGGLRILGVAKASFRKKELPTKQHDIEFDFLGLIGLLDPVRQEVPAAVRECLDAGIRLIMMTGDYSNTARKIAGQIGLSADDIITGDELDSLSDLEFGERLKTASVFARVVPEQKLRIVQTLKANGEIVGMTGDGVNDAPALMAAHVGIAMGKRGTDVAREASSIVLVGDDFGSIVEAIKNGRKIYANIKKAVTFVVAVHVPIAGLVLLPILLNWPPLLLPIHIVFLELIVDPACSVVFEAEPLEPNAMKKPPRKVSEKLFNKQIFKYGLLQGAGIFSAVLLLYFYTLRLGNFEESRAVTFLSLVVAMVCLIFVNRSWSSGVVEIFKNKNKSFRYMLAGIAILLIAILAVPAIRDAFHFDAPHFLDLMLAGGVGAFSILWFEIFKLSKRSLSFEK